MQPQPSALEYLQQPEWQHMRLGLARMQALLQKLGNPERELRFIHVAGTNGKGSVSAMLASVLTAAGCKTGLYTSPFLLRFDERIQIDGVPISETDLDAATRRVRQAADAMDDHPTEFELVTAIALLHFAHKGCSVVILEVGLGGVEDATNVIPTPEVAVITPISLDHTALLGGTLAEIAAKKGGIIKPGGHVVLAPQPEEAKQKLCQIAQQQGAQVVQVQYQKLQLLRDTLDGQEFSFGEWKDLTLPLLGSYQPQNAATALTAVQLLRQKGWHIPENAVRKGLAAVRWPARFELARKVPPVVVDGGHNPQGAAALAENLNHYFPGRRVNFVVGVMADKDYKAMFSAVAPLARRTFAVTPANPRALPAEKLAEELRALGFDDVTACDDIERAMQAALAATRREEVLCAFGTLYMAGEVRKTLGLA